MKKLKLVIEGMHCASCASNIERSLNKIEGIKSVSISMMLKKATLEVEDNVSVDDVKNAISKSGYEVSKIE
ncbi:hypothetical protein COU54_01525 [Candidatus Pacearchaeota archaeon CG10_big_fil_rev_8_21_14_0_10_31_24]|nr:MAG: hypothetical protein COU54_01525 [Candidatus Pacearchaeota archaeon CG10_big_fil_rev_8_21_14_0_10_31_24]